LIDFEKMLTLLLDAGVRFVVIGGLHCKRLGFNQGGWSERPNTFRRPAAQESLFEL
jgi:hypothetical protein